MRAIVISALLAALIDQASKYAVIHGLGVSPQKSIDVWPPILRFIYGENRGINFGLLGDGTNRFVFIGLALGICALVLYWIGRKPQKTVTYIAAGFLIGGAAGNVIDRLWYGYVLDFLNMSCCGIINPFVFNIADVFIFAGAIGLVFFADDGAPKRKKRA